MIGHEHIKTDFAVKDVLRGNEIAAHYERDGDEWRFLGFYRREDGKTRKLSNSLKWVSGSYDWDAPEHWIVRHPSGLIANLEFYRDRPADDRD